MEQFDYVIVGGGTAASLLAYRLSEGDAHSICVLEAGPPDSNPYIRIPAGFAKTLFDSEVTWQIALEPSDGTAGRRITVAQGRTLGGSSAINGMVFSRGRASDFDWWSEQGNSGWSYRETLPYFRRFESYSGPANRRFRGVDGPLPVTSARWWNPLCESFVESAESLGYALNPDYNGERQDGVGRTQSTIRSGRRQSAAHVFLHPASRRRSVSIKTNALVTRIIFEGKRAVAVAYQPGSGSTEVEVRARRAVVVSAGALNSPKLLQLSGIGPASLLRENGITVISDLTGVGENLRDHFGSRIVAKVTGTYSVNSRVSGWRLGLEIAKWVTGRPSALANSPTLVSAFGKSDPQAAESDFYLSFLPSSFKAGFIGRLDSFEGMTVAASPMRPESRGWVRIRSSSAHAMPIVQPNYLSEEKDRRVAIAAARAAREILRAPPVSRYVATEIMPGPDVNTDAEWLTFIRANAMSGYHYCGTCRMGPSGDPGAVVDAGLKVHGVEHLYVVDASVMPRTPSANTMAAIYMVSEKASDLLRGLAPLPPADI
jgi:choline dehydrogenase